MESMSTLLDALHAFQDYYARQLQLQEVLEASLYGSTASHASESDSSSSSDKEEEEEDKNEDEDENEDEKNDDEDETKNEDEENEDEDENEDELGLFTEENNWQSCPGCGATVGRRFDRCIHMICWCQCEFCYRCGEHWDENHFDTCDED